MRADGGSPARPSTIPLRRGPARLPDRPRSGAPLLLSGLLSIGLAACGGGEPPPEAEPARGVALVAGSALEHHGLLVVPRAGGRAEFRPLTDPGRPEWRGGTELPAATEVRAAGRTVLLRGEDGAVTRYDPAHDRLQPLGRVAADARWISAGRVGAFVGSHGILAVTETDARSIEPGAALLWAVPAGDGHVVGLTEAGGRVRAVSWPPGGSEPSISPPLPIRPPAVVAGWGATLVAATAEEGLAAYGLPGFEEVGSVGLDGSVTALVASPSSHRLYASVGGDEPGLVSIDRFGWAARRVAGVDRPVRALRVSVLGDYLLAFDGRRTLVAEVGGRSATTPLAWSEDLPIGLPGRRVLGRRGGGVVIVSPDGAAPAPVEVSAPSWWVAVPWGPARPVTRVAAAGTEDAAESGEAGEAAGRSVGLGTATQPIGAADETSIGAAPPSDEEAPRARAQEASIPAGFYAVAASARQIESVRTLQRQLERSGYPSHIFARRDEANDLWYRVMVGPYGSREAADEIARRLRGERGIRAWIREVPSGGAIGTRAGGP